jgi:amidase
MRLLAISAFSAVLLLLMPTLRAQSAPYPVAEASIAQLHEAIRTHQVTCRQLVEAYLARIDALDQTSKPHPLNAIIRVNPQALADADALDAEFAHTGKLRPLHGIPLIIKDNYDTQGLQTTGGSLALKGFAPETDAFMVKRLRDAGAIILAKSNMAEWAFSPYLTASSIAGITRNPYALDRVPAGSSGGTAAAVAASLGTAGLGTDTGNSIRGPSSHTMLVGIRPTLGLTSRDGIIPLFAHNDVGGPMARSVADAAALLTAVAGFDPADSVTLLSQPRARIDYTQSLKTDGLRGARIGIFRPYIDNPKTDPQIKALTEQAIRDLKAQGATIVDPFVFADYEPLTKDLWCGDFQADLDTWFARHAQNAQFHSLAEVVASGLYLPSIEEEMKASIAPPGKDERRSPCLDVYHDPPKIAFRNALLAAMERDHLDAIVYPTWSNPPRKVGDLTSPAGDNSQVLSPQTGFPAITVPMGFTHVDGESLPAGLTLLGRAFSEPQLIQYAYAYEQSTHHRQPPPLFTPTR